MRRNVLVADAGIAVGLAILVLIVAPGLAVVAIVAIGVLLVCAISFVLESRRHAKRTRARSRGRARRPTPEGRPVRRR